MYEKDSIQPNLENTSITISHNYTNSSDSFKSKTRESFKEREYLKRIESDIKRHPNFNLSK